MKVTAIGRVRGSIANPGKKVLKDGKAALYLSTEDRDLEGGTVFEDSSIEVEGEDAVSIVTSGTVRVELIPATSKLGPSVNVEATNGRAEGRQKGGNIVDIPAGEGKNIPLYFDKGKVATPPPESFSGCSVFVVGENVTQDPNDPTTFIIIGTALIVLGRKRRSEGETT